MTNKSQQDGLTKEELDILYLGYLIDQFIEKNIKFNSEINKSVSFHYYLAKIVFSSYALSSIIEQYENLAESDLSLKDVSEWRKTYWSEKRKSYVKLRINRLHPGEKHPFSGKNLYIRLQDKGQQRQLESICMGFGAGVASSKKARKLNEIFDSNKYEFIEKLGFYSNPYILKNSIKIIREYGFYKRVYSHDGKDIFSEKNLDIDSLDDVEGKHVELNDNMKKYAVTAVNKMIREACAIGRTQTNRMVNKWVYVRTKPGSRKG